LGPNSGCPVHRVFCDVRDRCLFHFGFELGWRSKSGSRFRAKTHTSAMKLRMYGAPVSVVVRDRNGHHWTLRKSKFLVPRTSRFCDVRVGFSFPSGFEVGRNLEAFALPRENPHKRDEAAHVCGTRFCGGSGPERLPLDSQEIEILGAPYIAFFAMCGMDARSLLDLRWGGIWKRSRFRAKTHTSAMKLRMHGAPVCRWCRIVLTAKYLATQQSRSLPGFSADPHHTLVSPRYGTQAVAAGSFPKWEVRGPVRRGCGSCVPRAQ
jgi:hypothetical protein